MSEQGQTAGQVRMGVCLISFLTTPDKPPFVTRSLETLSFGLGQGGRHVRSIVDLNESLVRAADAARVETWLNSTGFQT
jgi:hypothetical protein